MRNTKLKLAALLVALLVLPSCGGGGGSTLDILPEIDITPPQESEAEVDRPVSSSSWVTCDQSGVSFFTDNESENICVELQPTRLLMGDGDQFTVLMRALQKRKNRSKANPTGESAWGICRQGKSCAPSRITCDSNRRTVDTFDNENRSRVQVRQIDYFPVGISDGSDYAFKIRQYCSGGTLTGLSAHGGRDPCTLGAIPGHHPDCVRQPEPGTGTGTGGGTGGGTRCDVNTAWRGPARAVQTSSFCKVACATVDAAAQAAAAGHSDAASQYERQASVHCDLLRKTHERLQVPGNVQTACPVCNGR